MTSTIILPLWEQRRWVINLFTGLRPVKAKGGAGKYIFFFGKEKEYIILGFASPGYGTVQSGKELQGLEDSSRWGSAPRHGGCSSPKEECVEVQGHEVMRGGYWALGRSCF